MLIERENLFSLLGYMLSQLFDKLEQSPEKLIVSRNVILFSFRNYVTLCCFVWRTLVRFIFIHCKHWLLWIIHNRESCEQRELCTASQHDSPTTIFHRNLSRCSLKLPQSLFVSQYRVLYVESSIPHFGQAVEGLIGCSSYELSSKLNASNVREYFIKIVNC